MFQSIVKIPNLVRVWVIFSDFDVFIPLPLVASIFTEDLCVIFLALNLISFHDVLLLFVILTLVVPCRSLGVFIPAIP